MWQAMQRKVVWILVVAVVLIAVLIPLVHYVQWQTCVEGGGRWSFDTRVCEGAR